MAKYANNTVLDALLDAVKDGSILMIFNTSQPADRAAALSTALASVPVNSVDFSIGDAAPNGRQLTIASKSGITVVADGNVTHVSLVSGTELLYVTTAPIKNLTAGDSILSQAWSIRVADPV